eukprot:179669-Pelagomonas_calceolata.AAC.2
MVKSGGQLVDLQASCGFLDGQMDAEFKEEQIDTLLVWIGALEGGFWGGWESESASTIQRQQREGNGGQQVDMCME